MSDALKIALTSLVTGTGVIGAIVLIVYLTPEKAEKWYSIILRLLLALNIGRKRLHKTWVKHDIQGRVNSFVRTNLATIPGIESQRVSLQYVDSTTSKQAILENDSVIVRIRRDDPEDLNFVHAVCLFVSRSLLLRAKRYITPPQGEATDLLVSKNVLEKEKPAVVDHFLESYLHPAIDAKKSRTAAIFDDLVAIDKGSYFYPIYLRELAFLGQKVFGGRKDHVIAQEVTELIAFLKRLADREVGHDTFDLNFARSYCRFAIVIVGKAFKLHLRSEAPYVNFIRSHLSPDTTDTIYLLAPARNRVYVENVAEEVSDDFVQVCDQEFKGHITVRGERREAKTYLAVLRSRRLDAYVPRES